MIQELVDYLESTDLALFEYILEQTNQAFYAQHSWQVAESFLHLKSLASCPESIMKVLLLNSSDVAAKAQYLGDPNPGMGVLNKILFQPSRPGIWASYQSASHRSSREIADFITNLSALIPLIDSATSEDEYLGTNLSLATCIRNFTSHLVLERSDLLQNQYVRCIRSVISSLFLVWHEAKRRRWV
jgi:hypothetical protein